MKKLLFLLIPLLTVLSCKDDPCDDIFCYNDGYCEDGTCICPLGYTGLDCGFQVTPQKIILKSILITDFPATDGGFSWDSGSDPDIYPTIYNDQDELIFESSAYFVDAYPTDIYEFELDFDLNEPTERYSIVLFDYDEIGSDDYMAGIEFYPYHETNGFPEEIELYAGGLGVTLTVEYVF
jgi:hypothetical protein